MKRITLRIPDDVYDRLKEIQKEHQSLNNMIIEAVEKSLPDPAILTGKTQVDIKAITRDLSLTSGISNEKAKSLIKAVILSEGG